MTRDEYWTRDAAGDDADERAHLPCDPCAEGEHQWCDGGDCDCPCFMDPIDNQGGEG